MYFMLIASVTLPSYGPRQVSLLCIHTMIMHKPMSQWTNPTCVWVQIQAPSWLQLTQYLLLWQHLKPHGIRLLGIHCHDS